MGLPNIYLGLAPHDNKALIYKDFFAKAVGFDKKFVTPTRDTTLVNMQAFQNATA